MAATGGLRMLDPRPGVWGWPEGDDYTEGRMHDGLCASCDPAVVERLARFLNHGVTITAACGETAVLSAPPERSVPCPCGDEGSYIFRWIRR